MLFHNSLSPKPDRFPITPKKAISSIPSQKSIALHLTRSHHPIYLKVRDCLIKNIDLIFPPSERSPSQNSSISDSDHPTAIS
ncbi:MAG: hypothetical protein AAGE96_26655 [Cyanobacteria bacterium P01_G01_bin.19]